jgi:alkylhydroperoxidase family enzyme
MTQVSDVQHDTTWGSVTGGQQALVTYAPAAAEALAAVQAGIWQGELAGLLAKAASVCADNLGLAPLSPGVPAPAGTGLSDDDEKLALAFAEQLTIDVSAVTDEQRQGLIAQFGPKVGDYVQGLWVVDFLPRAWAALDALFGPTSPSPGPGPSPTSGAGGDAAPVDNLWDAIMEFIRVVPLLGLDPVTSELVRLRGARQHECRLCKSLRNRSAIMAGADDDMFAAVDSYETSSLSPRYRAALAFTDAMIWTPGHLDASVVEEVRKQFSPAEAVALVLWVTRNASNKIPVALAADEANITEGVEIYDIDETGDLVYGLTV